MKGGSRMALSPITQAAQPYLLLLCQSARELAQQRKGDRPLPAPAVAQAEFDLSRRCQSETLDTKYRRFVTVTVESKSSRINKPPACFVCSYTRTTNPLRARSPS